MQQNQPTQFDYRQYLALVMRQKRLFLAVALLIMTCAVIASYVIPKKYEATSTVFIEKNIISELVKGIAVSPSMEETIKVLTYAITSRSLLVKVIENLDLNVKKKGDAELENLIKSLQKNTNVKVKDKNLFTISFRDNNPRLTRDYVNTLVRLYIEENVSSKRGESYDATKFLSEQIDTYRIKLEQAESQVNSYKREKGGVISIDEGKLFQEINTAQQKVYDLELRRRQLEGMRQVTKKTSDPLQGKLLAMQKRLEELRLEYTENFPEVIKVKGEIEELKAQIRGGKGETINYADPQEMAKIDAEISAIRVSEDGMKRYIAANQAILRTIPSAKAGLDKLEVEKNNQKQLYDQLFARHGQSEVSKQMEVQDKTTTFRIVDPAVMPIKPASPNRLRIMLMGIVGGIAAALGVLVLLDQLDGSVKNVATLKGLGVPVLAVIPRVPDPLQQLLQRARDRKIYAVAGAYFMVILGFVALEAAGLNYVDRVLDKVQVAESLQNIRGK